MRVQSKSGLKLLRYSHIGLVGMFEYPISSSSYDPCTQTKLFCCKLEHGIASLYVVEGNRDMWHWTKLCEIHVTKFESISHYLARSTNFPLTCKMLIL